MLRIFHCKQLRFCCCCRVYASVIFKYEIEHKYSTPMPTNIDVKNLLHEKKKTHTHLFGYVCVCVIDHR